MTDPAGSLTYLNRVWSEFTGRTTAESLGYGAWQALHPDDVAPSQDTFFAAHTAREAFRLDYRLRRADGRYRWALSVAAPRITEDGSFLGYIGSVIDITERKEAEQILQQANELLEERVAAAIAGRMETEAQLRQAQKMEAIGKLTGGVAHDFNNVLQVIGGNLQLLVRDVAGNLRAEQRLQTAIAAISRGSKLASQLLAFGRRQPLTPKVVNLGRLVRSIDDILRRALGEGVEIETVIAGGLWNTFVDMVQVENALLNLAINARDAMGGHGKLTIEAGNAALDDAYVRLHADVTTGQYVMLAVTDTGCGIPPELIEQVFEPFFTTKPEGQGTGLGLSMVYGFVKQSGGHVKIYSELGQGTTVRLYLPRTRAEEDVESQTEAGPVTGGSETVLVVEDDDEVRNTVVDMLAELGYSVLKARDAQSALAIIESGMAIDLLFTDVVMPGTLRSPELARRACKRLPDIAVLFTSGYTDNAIVHGGRLDDGIDLLSKPYSREALARKLRHVLRNQRQRDLADRMRPARSNESRVVSQAERSLRVLFVEDDPLIRFVTTGMLETLGHAVVEAATAAEALAILNSRSFDIIATDLALGDGTGSELAARALSRQPGLKVLFVTGYGELPDTVSQPELRGAVLLRKPYSQARLAEALRDTMTRPS
jgi:PAS domain S-box-containing protein